MPSAEQLLADVGLRPTPNRVLTLRAIIDARRPVSLIDLEQSIATLERSSVSRVLASLTAAGLIHGMEDGRGVARYELCHGPGHHHSPADMHAHFYCEQCGATYCLPAITVAAPELPPGFRARSLNYMLKGTCPRCTRDAAADSPL